jgi:hypothetical protein
MQLLLLVVEGTGRPFIVAHAACTSRALNVRTEEIDHTLDRQGRHT